MKLFNRQQPRYDNFQVAAEMPQPLTKRVAIPEDSKATNMKEWVNGEWITTPRKPIIESLIDISENLK